MVHKDPMKQGVRGIETLPGGSLEPPSGARPRRGARKRASGGRVCHGARPGTARTRYVASLSSACGPTTHRNNRKGRVRCHMRGSECVGPRRIRPGRQKLALGTWNVTSLWGKEPELVCEVERYQLDLVGLTSTHSLGFGTLLLDRGWTPFFSGVAQVSEIRGWGKTLDRPGKPKRVVRVNWERLEEAPLREIFNSHLQQSFLGIPVDVGGIEPEWAIFKASIAEAAALSCGLKVLGASKGGNPRTLWWTTVVREAVRLKESFRDMLSQRTPEAVAGYRRARRAAAAAVSRQSSGCGRSSAPRCFRSAPRCFWKTVRHLRRGKRGTIQAVYSKNGTLLTSTDDVIGWWKEHFEELLNPTFTPSSTEAELEADGGSSSVSLREIAEVAMVRGPRHPFPTVDVPDHAHYTIGTIILAIGIIGIVGNFLVIYAFSRSRSLKTPANMFIINLAITDLLMCLTQPPMFFTTSMYKRWIFGDKACELYAFCGALFGICSMITMMVIAMDRYFVITRPLSSIGVLSKKRALLVLMAAWVYSLGWSLPPFFGWSAYVPEGLLTSCTWDYMTFTPSVRAYTMLLFTFVFFLPLIVIVYCYFFIFRAIRATKRAVTKMNATESTRGSSKHFHRLKNEWKMAKIALIVILFFVISWSPYSAVALTSFAGHADYLTPYMNSVPAVIAKASAIHNPIIYAITHPKYRTALAKYIPCLGVLLCVRRSTVTSQTSEITNQLRRTSTIKSRRSSASDSESGWTDTEADMSSMISRPASRQVSCDISKDTAELSAVKTYSSFSFVSKMKSHDSGVIEKSFYDVYNISITDVGLDSHFLPSAEADLQECPSTRGLIGQIPRIVITSETSPILLVLRASSHGSHTRPVNDSLSALSHDVFQQGSTLPSNNSDTSFSLI
ncbi:hypothetical protein DPEC_G00040310 [Dallia pectoralis]|uniref:Uncharacterized protein n=1 Tax=Dallia pectoralis TaxID=75939 RepID=A0ACC2HEV7_DALPE|nr:hypothetical protein DPEC_G00040310 [Dallia pectoralis]